MNRLKIYIIATVLLFGCTPKVTFVPGETNIFGVDFSKFSEFGFLITPYGYDEEYQSIGLLTLEAYPEAKYEDIPESKRKIKHYEEKEWLFEELKLEELINKIYNNAKEMGADALIDFKIKTLTKEVNVGGGLILHLSGIQLTGFAIKRK